MSSWRNERSLGLKIAERLHKIRWRCLPEWILEEWTAHRLKTPPNYWLFLLSPNNSGSTLLSRVIKNHPKIRSLPVEGQWLTQGLLSEKRLGHSRTWGNFLERVRLTEDDSAENALRVKYDWAFWFPNRPGILFEKSSPSAVRGRWFQAYFQPSRFILLFRHPFPVCEGIRRRTKCPIEFAARHYKNVVNTMITDIPFLDHHLIVRYEDFVLHPSETFTTIQKFLELNESFDISILNRSSVHSIEGTTSGLKNLNARSAAELTESDKRLIRNLMQNEMDALGYREDL